MPESNDDLDAKINARLIELEKAKLVSGSHRQAIINQAIINQAINNLENDNVKRFIFLGYLTIDDAVQLTQQQVDNLNNPQIRRLIDSNDLDFDLAIDKRTGPRIWNMFLKEEFQQRTPELAREKFYNEPNARKDRYSLDGEIITDPNTQVNTIFYLRHRLVVRENPSSSEHSGAAEDRGPTR